MLHVAPANTLKRIDQFKRKGEPVLTVKKKITMIREIPAKNILINQPLLKL